MATGYDHLSYEERCQIHALSKRGDSLREIARQLVRSPSTISREVRRNSGRRGYRFQQANRFAIERRRKASLRPRKMTEALWALVREKLALQWSPEQISGRLRRDGVVAVSTTWIYRYSWSDRAAGGVLYKQLRRSGKRYNRRSKSGAGRGMIPHRVDISERDPIVEQKTRIGDWEVDTIIGAKYQGALVSMVDRASKFTFLEPVSSKAAIGVRRAIIDCLDPVKDRVLTITADNGKEFAHHQQIARALSASFYFARPYHSWERGLNEHTNGLVRQYFPKSTNFHTIEPAAVKRVQTLLNQRPRQCLAYRAPAEVFLCTREAVTASTPSTSMV